MPKKIAIVQSNYIPWKGYFDLIAAADAFVLYDDMQYTRRDWRNRNQIKTAEGLQWLTVPVQVKGKYAQTIYETEIDGMHWAAQHARSLRQNYGKAPHFDAVMAVLEPLYATEWRHLSAMNRAFLEAICAYLSITTPLLESRDYVLAEGKSDRLADLVAQLGGDMYISGPAARDYLDAAAFSRRGIGVEWFDYGGYPEYPQFWGEFTHGVSILDLLFHCGKDAPAFMKHQGP